MEIENIRFSSSPQLQDERHQCFTQTQVHLAWRARYNPARVLRPSCWTWRPSCWTYVHCRAKMMCISDKINPELPCKVYDEFRGVCSANRLSLTTGPLKFEYFRQCLSGNTLMHWDAILTISGGTNTNNDFMACITSWFEKYMGSTIRSSTSSVLPRLSTWVSRQPTRVFWPSSSLCSTCMELLLTQRTSTLKPRRRWHSSASCSKPGDPSSIPPRTKSRKMITPGNDLSMWGAIVEKEVRILVCLRDVRHLKGFSSCRISTTSYTVPHRVSKITYTFTVAAWCGM